MKYKQRILLIAISILVGILELVLLINVFPQTGMERIIYIPFWIISYLSISIWSTKKSKTLKKSLVNLVIIHLILFHIMLWSWPQAAAIQKNLVKELYGKVYKTNLSDSPITKTIFLPQTSTLVPKNKNRNTKS